MQEKYASKSGKKRRQNKEGNRSPMMLDIFAIWITQPGPALLWTALGFLVGALIGHFFALDRDKRREFNEIANPTRTLLRRELSNIRANAQWVGGDALDLLVDMASWHKRKRLRDAVSAYKKARGEHVEVGPAGDRFYSRTDHVEAATRNLLAQTTRR